MRWIFDGDGGGFIDTFTKFAPETAKQKGIMRMGKMKNKKTERIYLLSIKLAVALRPGFLANKLATKMPFCLEMGVDKQRAWHLHATFSILLRFFFLLYDRLNVTLVVMDGDPVITHGTFGIFAPMTLAFDDGVLGLAVETCFHRLAQFGDKMMLFALDTIKVVVTMRTIIGGSSATNIIWTVKAPTSTTVVILTRMVGSIVSVEALFAIQQ